jgi:hypothetical protein
VMSFLTGLSSARKKPAFPPTGGIVF